MGLTSSLYAGISGLNALGTSMQIIGDNIANVNTVGFKNSTYAFQDLLSQNMATMSGTSQMGRGVAMGSAYADFEQSSFDSTGSVTDFGISGDGFFQLRESDGTSMYYSRAGNFHFDNSGYLVNPEGYVVQGWALDATGATTGSETDIQISASTSPPSETDEMTVITNLDADATSNTANLETVWDGTATTPLASTLYEHSTTIQVYDSLGSQHDITIYFDPDATANVWEYIITCDPSEDQRAFITAAAPTQYAGLLARGTMTFDPATGQMTAAGPTMDTLTAVAPTWTASTTNANGFFEFNPTFIAGTAMTVAFDPGTNDSATAGTFVNDSLTTTQYARNSDTAYLSQNGYAAGDLQSFDVDTDGTINGVYSNGQLTPLYRVALSSFMNNQGLLKEGGNLFRATTESGTFTNHEPGTNGVGTIIPNSLEQSNVDIAAEFVRMITTQRGYQANSKIISTVDAMLAEAVQMKR